MNIIGFQDSGLPLPVPVEEWLRQALEAFEGGFGTAAAGSRDFFIDVGSAVVALVWLAATVLITVWIGRHIRRWLTGRATARWPDRPNRATLIDKALMIAFMVLAVLFGLRTLGIDPSSLATAIGIIVAALSIALQDVIKNFVAGVYLLVEQPFQPGDRLSIPGADGGKSGVVESVHLRVTNLRTTDQELILVPNAILFSQIVVNRTSLVPYALHVRLSTIDAPASRVEDDIRDALSPILGAQDTTTVSLLSAGPLGTAADVRIWFESDPQVRQAVIVALNEHFPEASLEVVSG